MENKRQALRVSSLKVFLGSLIGVFIFFTPVTLGEEDKKIPLVIIIDSIKEVIGGYIDYITLGFILVLCTSWVLAKLGVSEKLKIYHKEDGCITGLLFILAGIFGIFLVIGYGPGFIINEDVGELAIYIAGTVLLTVIIAGFFSFFIIGFGLAEFIGILLEPIMRPVYKVPGRAAVDAVTSFVASPAVGVFITNKLYKEGKYTQREAASIAANFSVEDIGFITVLASIAGVLTYLPQVIIFSFLITFVLAAITSRLPPLSNKLDNYYLDKEENSEAPDDRERYNILRKACLVAAERASHASLSMALESLWNAIKFAQKIAAYVLSIATLALVIATYTNFFSYVGFVFEPILNAFSIPSADKVSPAVLISITEVALPSIIVSSEDIPTISAFFICVLSIVQIIFFTESANAMLEAEIPLSFLDLVIIFLIRTILAIPLVAIAAHIVF
ncbi:YjiH family protein [Halomonas sp.]|uniref:YjiH family protein n=1 Tax=Halomonas sp. TaxID=1486246 RepID=UPI003F9AE74E